MSTLVRDVTGVDATTGCTWRLRQWSDGTVRVERMLLVGEKVAA